MIVEGESVRGETADAVSALQAAAGIGLDLRSDQHLQNGGPPFCFASHFGASFGLFSPAVSF